VERKRRSCDDGAPARIDGGMREFFAGQIVGPECQTALSEIEGNWPSADRLGQGDEGTSTSSRFQKGLNLRQRNITHHASPPGCPPIKARMDGVRPWPDRQRHRNQLTGGNMAPLQRDVIKASSESTAASTGSAADRQITASFDAAATAEASWPAPDPQHGQRNQQAVPAAP